MSELTLTIIRLGLLILLWVFVFSVVGVLRGDLYGTRVVSRLPGRRSGDRAAKPAKPKAAPQKKPRRGSRVPHSLTVTEGPLAGTSLRLRESGTLIGRNPECALVLDDDFASGRHARIFERDGQWFVEDLGSTNGTFLGTQRLSEPAPVAVGSVLRVGRTVVELRN
ncbi:FHA domain-containing protein [Knoellia sp. 3-2P3]|uniref:FHA domain-containing protein FhaB/FipA n=1 Tax=unclassified Knoellia TaxID=2618719 RepID=UPI0023DB4AA3|nr:FHA domain-containing protein [Knoellia sp. 3-2P3]MDF2091259.1 FHA domain-containing protein [Knoellia sp. 3-2P3]